MPHPAPNSEADLSAYDYLQRLSPDRWAWEFLRRNPAFRCDAAARTDTDLSERMAPCVPIRLVRSRAPQTFAERWGLVFMPNPDRNGFDADVVWNRSAFPDQVEVHCTPRALDERCELWDRSIPICNITHITDPVGREYLLVRRNDFVVQLCCTGLSLLGLEPVRMTLAISGVDDYERRVKLQKAAFEIYGDHTRRERPAWTKTTQVLRDGLIALDCIEHGMSRREIACVLHGRQRVEQDWDGPSLKHAIRYLVRKAEALRDGGYQKELLGAEPTVAGV
ncbi:MULTISPECIES: DNA -binding domain-containing protein [Hyphomonas]|nr:MULTISPECIES: DUF2285 domain-containing protein [Hyphomonas]|tara:strand:- start:45 stop:881 length:837 start_codon:yes stop_codon:yes gene_type:complete